MKVMAQMAMVMNLDKCIGCHTCSVTCKQAWTNRSGTEYVWFNNVETRPGQGYPRTYEDQDRWQGGWTLNKRGRLTLRAGNRFRKLLTIFSNPKLPSIDDYYEPWTYDYATLTEAPAQRHTPVARPKSLISGKDMKIPPDLQAAIDAEPAARAMLGRLTEQNRFALVFRVHMMKTEAGRRRKIETFVEMLKRGETIYPQKRR